MNKQTLLLVLIVGLQVLRGAQPCGAEMSLFSGDWTAIHTQNQYLDPREVRIVAGLSAGHLGGRSQATLSGTTIHGGATVMTSGVCHVVVDLDTTGPLISGYARMHVGTQESRAHGHEHGHGRWHDVFLTTRAGSTFPSGVLLRATGRGGSRDHRDVDIDGRARSRSRTSAGSDEEWDDPEGDDPEGDDPAGDGPAGDDPAGDADGEGASAADPAGPRSEPGPRGEPGEPAG